VVPLAATDGAAADGETAGSFAPLNSAVELPVALVRRWRGQPREWFDEEKLRELADSIRERGILQPIRVRPDRRSHLDPGGYLITVGERRFLAAQLAGLQTVPAIIHDVDETQALLDALNENIQRQDLTPDEENEAIRRLRERGLQDKEIARRLGVSRSTISRLAAVFDSPTLGPRVADGRLSLTQARELLNLGEVEQMRLAEFLLLRQRR
jgi:ParB family transcriptional regulator, chromosome partitioning protein